MPISLRRAAVLLALVGGLLAAGFLCLLDRYLASQDVPSLWRLAVAALAISGFALAIVTAAVFSRALLARLAARDRRLSHEVKAARDSLADLVRKESEKCTLERAEVSFSLMASLASVGDLVRQRVEAHDTEPPTVASVDTLMKKDGARTE